jgi:hypothetical protein
MDIKKINLLFFIFILSLASAMSVSATQSTDRTDYYYNGTYYFTDGLESTDIAFNGTPITINGSSAFDYGWSDADAMGTAVYDSTRSSLGTYSLKLDAPNSIASIIIQNSTFAGIVSLRWYDNGGSQTSGFYVYGTAIRMSFIYTSDFSPTNYYYYANSSWYDSGITRLAGTWLNITFNFSGSDIACKVNGIDIASASKDAGGLDNIKLYSGDLGSWFDEIFITNTGEIPQTPLVEIGTPENPFIITTPAELDAMRDNLTVSYALGNDIDMGSWGNWTPVGDWTNYFEGTFDGRGHTISNLYIPVFDNGEIGGWGFFGSIDSSAFIKNVNFENLYIQRTDETGGYGECCVGTLAGAVDGEVSITQNVHVTGRIDVPTLKYVGGFYGYLSGGNIYNSSFEGNISADMHIGGFSGEFYGTYLNDSYTKGKINATSIDTETEIGGLFGEVQADATITDSYSQMDVQVEYSDNTLRGIGGLIGFSKSYTVNVNDVYYAGFINIITTNGTVPVYNIAGGGTVICNNVYYIESTGISGDGCSSGTATNLSIVQAKQESSYTGFDFTNIWGINEGASYPYFLWNPVEEAPSIVTYEDTFIRPNNTILDKNWTEVMGTSWRIEDNSLMTTTAADEAFLNLTSYWGVNMSYLYFKWNGTTDISTMYAFIGYNDYPGGNPRNDHYYNYPGDYLMFSDNKDSLECSFDIYNDAGILGYQTVAESLCPDVGGIAVYEVNISDFNTTHRQIRAWKQGINALNVTMVKGSEMQSNLRPTIGFYTAEELTIYNMYVEMNIEEAPPAECTDDENCSLCMKCSGGSCVNELSNEDAKSECNVSTTCSGYAVQEYNGLCNGAGACNTSAITDCPTCQVCSAGSCANELSSEDLKDDCSQSYLGCVNNYTMHGDNGLCDGAGVCDADTGIWNVSVGNVCIESSVNKWNIDERISNGLVTEDTYLTPSVFYKDSTWYLISGNEDGVFLGFNWTEAGWQQDNGSIIGLTDVGQASSPSVFYKDSTWYLISGSYYNQPAPYHFFGFNWTGSAWQQDDGIILGLDITGSSLIPSVFYKDSTWHLITGVNNGTFYGFNWTGTTWQEDDGIVNGLGYIGQYNAPSIFEKDGTWYLIAGAEGDFYGFNWTGSTWQQDDGIVGGLSAWDGVALSVFEKDGTWYFITGNSTEFFGFNWASVSDTNPTSEVNCGIWSNCVQYAASADQYYIGYAGDGTSTCVDIDWQSTGSFWNVSLEGYLIDTTEKVENCSESDYSVYVNITYPENLQLINGTSDYPVEINGTISSIDNIDKIWINDSRFRLILSYIDFDTFSRTSSGDIGNSEYMGAYWNQYVWFAGWGIISDGFFRSGSTYLNITSSDSITISLRANFSSDGGTRFTVGKHGAIWDTCGLEANSNYFYTSATINYISPSIQTQLVAYNTGQMYNLSIFANSSTDKCYYTIDGVLYDNSGNGYSFLVSTTSLDRVNIVSLNYQCDGCSVDTRIEDIFICEGNNSGCYTKNPYDISEFSFINNTALTDGNYSVTIYANNSVGMLGNDSVTFNFEDLYHEAIAQILNSSCNATMPVQASTVNMPISFSIKAVGGNNNLSAAAAQIKLDSNIFQGTCTITPTGDVDSRADCNITMQYYYPAGLYDLNVSIYDGFFHNTTYLLNTSYCEYYQLLSSKVSLDSVSFAIMTPGMVNVSAQLPLMINNTGNTLLQVGIIAYDLTGSVLSGYSLPASNFRVNTVNDAVSSIVLENNTQRSLNYNISGGNTVNLYFFATIPRDIYPQMYYSLLPWSITTS